MFTSTSAVSILALAVVTAVGLSMGSFTATTITSTMSVKNKYVCQNGKANLKCDIQHGSGFSDNTECTWWKNDEKLNISSKYGLSRAVFSSRECHLTINDVQEKTDAQPTDYRCRDGDGIGRVTIRLWIREELPVDSLVLTVGGQALANGEMLNLTALSHLHPPPIIKCSIGPTHQATQLRVELNHMEEFFEQEFSWWQMDRSPVSGHLMNSTFSVLANDTQLVTGQTLSCSTLKRRCPTHKKFEDYIEVTIVGK